LHVIPSIIPEAVLGTKEPSEKARTAAFDVILAMGRKMSEGGVVKKSVMDGMDVDAGDGLLFSAVVLVVLFDPNFSRCDG
jgi:ribosomal RNA-processing protein 12